jgi:indolepyruvate decarboxylase
VGELSALNGVMGARAQRLPVFHIVGAPSTKIQKQGLITHHTLGDGVFNNFQHLSAAACCVTTNLTPDNVVSEMERVISEALRLSAPAYITVPMDLAKMPIIGSPVKGSALASIKRVKSDPASLSAALDFVISKIQAAKSAVALPTYLVGNYGLREQLLDFLTQSKMSFATTPMDKGIVSESHPQYLGIYSGAWSSPPGLNVAVEAADLLLDIGGVVFEDFNTTFWTSQAAPQKLLTLGDNFVRQGNTIFTGVSLQDIIEGLTARLSAVPKFEFSAAQAYLPMVGESSEPTASANVYPRIQKMLKPGDVYVVETGSCTIHSTPMLLPEGVGFQTQTLWGSIGWATPAAMGICMANKNGRTILITGDGSHQLTANEIGVMGRYGIKPIIFVLNNGAYGVEIVLSEKGLSYDDLAKWNYAQLPAAMGCESWFSARVRTVAELDTALVRAQQHDGASYIEIMIAAEESQPLPENILQQIYQSTVSIQS